MVKVGCLDSLSSVSIPHCIHFLDKSNGCAFDILTRTPRFLSGRVYEHVHTYVRTCNCFIMATSSTSKFATKLSEATEAGDKFVRLFYETFDKRRQVEQAS